MGESDSEGNSFDYILQRSVSSGIVRNWLFVSMTIFFFFHLTFFCDGKLRLLNSNAPDAVIKGQWWHSVCTLLIITLCHYIWCKADKKVCLCVHGVCISVYVFWIWLLVGNVVNAMWAELWWFIQSKPRCAVVLSSLVVDGLASQWHAGGMTGRHLHRQWYVLAHWHRPCRSNLVLNSVNTQKSHPHWHRPCRSNLVLNSVNTQKSHPHWHRPCRSNLVLNSVNTQKSHPHWHRPCRSNLVLNSVNTRKSHPHWHRPCRSNLVLNSVNTQKSHPHWHRPCRSNLVLNSVNTQKSHHTGTGLADQTWCWTQ